MTANDASKALLPSYNPTASCPKCGNVANPGMPPITTVYDEGHQCGDPNCSLLERYPEHLRRTCNRCHYGWDEAVVEGDRP